jgi:hypothetical protein
MAVMMQGFYWDCAVKEDKRGEWWNFPNGEVPSSVVYSTIWERNWVGRRSKRNGTTTSSGQWREKVRMGPIPTSEPPTAMAIPSFLRHHRLIACMLR